MTKCHRCGKDTKSTLDYCNEDFPHYLKMVGVGSIVLIDQEAHPFEARLQSLAIKGFCSAWRNDAPDALDYLLSIASRIGKKYGGTTIKATAKES